ncbi:stress-activated map kinase interacting protein 1-domain-containing protein [Syncephalastrum racemosum]|uniref:Stress-activated map kinase interacting protein 1-domain-containing protein n=1 Tax=Syncephalastrum racemosum TaxID=13706 RepID=A0A1X2HF44_SYNRA|nr:stress-activated map kinase interacting protein 1-domain-containing protein [Syncephalastrum racemosum]
MSLITDANFLIHEMRIKLLRFDERGDRIISFRPAAMSDDYTRFAAPTYPEMQYCYSPVYDSLLSKGTNANPNLTSSPRTKRSHFRLRKQKEPQNPPALPRPAHGQGDDTTAEEFGLKEDKPLPTVPMRKQSAPTLCVTEASKATTAHPSSSTASSMNSNSTNNRHRFTTADDNTNTNTSTNTTSSLHKETVIRSHTRTTSSTTFSFHGTASEHATMSLHPSIESTLDASPRSSIDVVDDDANQASFPLEQPPSGDTLLSDDIENHKKQTTMQSYPHSHPHPHLSGSPVVPLHYTKVAPHLPPPLQTKSALSALIAEKAKGEENPFSEFSFVSGRGEANPITLCVYLPHSFSPFEPVSLVVRPDAIVDDVIGYILYDYVENKRTPEIDEDLYDIAQWVLRIAEDDGEIEEDLPALDRTRQINMVSFDQFALCRAAAGQVKQNEAIRAKLGRKYEPRQPVKTTQPPPAAAAAAAATAATMAFEPTQGLAVPPTAAAQAGSVSPTFPAGDLGPLDPVPVAQTHQEADSSAVAVPIPSSKAMLTKSTMPMTPLKYFRIRLMTNEEVSATTTIPVYAEMFIGDVLELVSRKRKLDPDEYMLTINDSNVVVPNDTTVESMRAITELCLIRKGAGLTMPSSSHLWRSPNKKKKDEMYFPAMFNASPSGTGASNNALYSQYKKYAVNRKMPMFVGRRESNLAIDGDYIHIMPPEHKGMFDSVKTSSFHANSVISCKQSKKARNHFKITVAKDQSHKTYDFEAENAKEAQEICARIGFLMKVAKAP